MISTKLKRANNYYKMVLLYGQLKKKKQVKTERDC